MAKLPISVLIDTYNHERFIEKAINSVLEQGFPVTAREIIVVDDGSTDRTPQIVKRFEAHLRYIRKENGGQASGQEFFHRRAWSDTPEPKLLFVGTWIDHKGIYALAEAFERLLALAPGVQLTIAGCAETEERVRNYFSPAAQGSINVRPFISRAEMPELFAQHDIFVLPSLVEGMPLVLLEAMASGLAVVTTESSGMTDLVEDGHDGLLTIPGDADSLTMAIITLCGNSQLRHKLGCAAQEKMKRFTWKLSAMRHEAIFRRAMGVKPIPTVPEPQETNVDGDSYSGKVVLN